MEQDKWSKIIVHWVNCLTIPNLKVTSSRDLDVRILYQLINHLDSLENGETDDTNHYSNVLTSFLKREYPHFNEHAFLEKLDEEQSVIIASLLLHYSCIKTKDVGVRGAMCQRLSPNDQKAIMFFANSLMKYENITEKNIKDTMTVLPLSEVGSPMPSGSSPGWAGSPATPPGRKSRRSRRLMRLEAALETERFDRTYLQEELRRQAARVQEMEKQQALQVSEITALRGELSSCYNGSYLGGEGGTGGIPGQDGGAAEAQRLRRDLAGLEQELLKVVGDLANMTLDRETMRKKVGEVEKELMGWRARAMEFENMTDAMQTKLEEDKSQMSGLKMELAEKNKMLEEYRQEHQLNESIECDDDTSTLKKAFSSSFGVENLGNAVIDVQLKEQIIQNTVLTSQITELQNDRKTLDNELKVLTQQYDDSRRDYQDLSMSNIELKNEVNITKHELDMSQKEILVKITEISLLVEQNNCAQDLAKQQEGKLIKLNEEMSEKINEIKMTNQEKLKLQKDLENSQNIIENRMVELKNNSDLINVLNNSIKILEHNSCTLLKEKECAETEFRNTVKLLTLEKSALESELRNNTESHDKEILEKVNQLVQLNARLEGVLNDNAQLQREFCSLEAEKVLYQNQCEEKQSKIDNISKEFDVLTKENKGLSDKILNIEKSLTLHLETIESLTMISEKNLTSHAETIETLNEEHSSIVDLKNSKIQSLSDEINNLKELVIDTENKLIAVEKEKFKHLSEIEKLIQAGNLLENDFTVCKDELQICKNELATSNNIIETKSKEMINLTETNESLNSHLLQNDKIINELGNTLNDLRKQKMECEDLLEKKDIKILSLVEKLLATETDIAVKIDCVTLLESERSNLQESLSTLSEQREQLSAEISSLNNEVVLLNNANLQIQTSNDLLNEKNHNLEQELVKCKKDVHHLSKAIELKDELSANVQKNVSVLSDKIDILSTKVVSLQESLVLQCEETVAIQNYNNVLQSKLDNLEADLESKTSKIITLNENTINLEENIQSLKSELTNSQEKIKKCNAFSQKLLQEKFTVIEESKSMKLELEDVQTKLAAEVNSAEHISAENIKLEQSLKIYLAENLQLHEDKSEFLEIIEKNQTIIINLESELDDFMIEYKNKVSSLTDKECQLEEQISLLKNVIDNEQKNVHTKNLLIDKLSQECDQLKTACATLTSSSIENQEKLQEIVHQQEHKIRNLTQYTTELKNDKDNIQNSLQITNTELKKFQEDLHLKMNEMETFSKQNVSLQNEITVLKEQEDNQNNVLLNKDTLLTNLSYEKFKVEQQLEEKTAQLISVNDQVELLKNEIIQKEKLVDNYETKSEDLKEEVRLAQSEIDKLTNEKLDIENLHITNLEQLNNDLERKTAEAKILKEINNRMTAEKLELLNTHKTELCQLKSFLEKKNKEVEIFQDQIDKLTIEKLEVLDLHESNLNHLNMDLNNKSSEVEVLKNLNEKITAENIEVKANLEEMKTILETKTSEIVSLNYLTEKNTVEIVEIQNLHKENSNKLESAVEIKTNKIQLLKGENEKISEENLEVKTNLEEMAIILKTKTEEIIALNNINEKNKLETFEIQNLHKENLKHLESVLEIKSNEVELLKELNERIIVEKLDIINLHQTCLNQLENELQTKSSEVDNFKYIIDKITAEKLDILSRQKINLDQMTSDLASKMDQIEIFEDQIEKLTMERHEILNLHEANSNQLKDILETKTAEIDMLRKMTAEKCEELNSNKLNLDTMKAEIESKTAAVQALKEVNKKLIAENREVINMHENNLDQLKSDLATKVAEVENLKEMVEKLNAEKIEVLTINKSNLDQLANDLETKSTEVESSKDLVEKLTAENIDVLTVHKTNLNQLRIDLENKTTEVETLKDMVEKLTAEKIDVTTEHATNLNQMKIDLEKKTTEVQTFKELVEKQKAEKCDATIVHEANLSQLRIALKNKIADIETFKEQVDKIEAEKLSVLHLHQTNLDQLSCELETKSTQVETFRELVEKLTAAKIDVLTLHKTNLNQLKVELENKTADIDIFKDVVEKMSLERVDVLNLHQTILDQLRSDLVTKTTEVEVLKDLNSNFQNKIESLSVQIQNHEQEINNFNEKHSCVTHINQDLSTKLQSFKCLKDEETSLKLRLSNVQHEFEKTLKLLSNKNEELLLKTAEVDNQLQEISKLKEFNEDQNAKLKDVEYNLIKITNENEILKQEKVDMENCIDGVKLILVGDELLEYHSDIPHAVFEDNSLDFEHALNCNPENTEKTQGINVDSENKKITNLKSKLTQLCNSTEMISKTCAKNILQKDDIILKLSDECSCLKEHIKQINNENGNLQQKLYDVEEDNINQRIDYETQIEQLETLRHSELQDKMELDRKLNIQLEAAKLQISLSQQNEKTLFKIVFSKVQEFSDFMKQNEAYSYKLKSVEDMLSKSWEVVCEAVKRLKAISLPIMRDVFPLNLQVPIMDSLKFLDSEHFDSSKTASDLLATIMSSIDFVDNYVDNLCKVIVSLVQDRITCRDSLGLLQKQNTVLSNECQTYKKKYEETTNEMNSIAEKLSEVELVKEKLAKSLNNSDAISSTTSSSEFHIPPNVEDFIKKINENGSRLKKTLSFQEAQTKEINMLKESLHKLNDSFCDYLGDKIALRDALSAHKDIENEISAMEVNSMRVLNEIVRFSSDMCLFTGNSLLSFKENSESDTVDSCQDLGIDKFEKQLQNIETESANIENNIPKLQASLTQLETKKSTRGIGNTPSCINLEHQGLPVYERMQILVEKYVLIQQDLSIYENAKISTTQSLKQMQDKNAELSIENNELMNKVSALRKVLKEIESKNNEMMVANEELKCHKEHGESALAVEKELQRKTMNENMALRNQVTTLSYKMDELKLRLNSEMDEVKSASERLLVENQKLQARLTSGGDTNQLVTDMRNEYEDKLTRMKQKMKQLYQEQIAVYTEKQKDETTGLEALCKKYSEKINKYETHVNHLMFEQWKVGEKLLNEKKQNDELRKRLEEWTGSHQSLNSITSTVSLPQSRMEMRRNTISARAPSRRPYPSPVKELPMAFKKSHSNKAESGGLHMSDEEGEVFDNTYLTELQAGGCTPRASSTLTGGTLGTHRQLKAAPTDNRLSELQWRNSLCLPHLKSSYPAESQFHRFREEDIKMGGTITLDDSPSVEKPRTKKEAGQTSYHKPGPPTPSKNGGRLSLQGNEREVLPLREQNDMNHTKKATTPSRIKSLFMGNTSKSTSRDENTLGTPKGRRLSIFRKPR